MKEIYISKEGLKNEKVLRPFRNMTLVIIVFKVLLKYLSEFKIQNYAASKSKDEKYSLIIVPGKNFYVKISYKNKIWIA